MILISLSYFSMAELANIFPLFAFPIMADGLLVMKCFPAFIWAFIIYSGAFLIQMINEVFDFHCMAGLIAPISSTPQNTQIFIDLSGQLDGNPMHRKIICTAFSA